MSIIDENSDIVYNLKGIKYLEKTQNHAQALDLGDIEDLGYDEELSKINNLLLSLFG